MKKRVLSILLAIVLMLSSMPLALADSTNNYKIDWLVQNGIVKGRNGGDLALQKNITRAEFARMVLASTGELEAAEAYTLPATFKDISSDHWAQKIIAYATFKGYLAGYTDGTFRPDAFIKQVECIAILVRLSPNYVEPQVKPAYWAQAYIDYAKTSGLLDGIDSTKNLEKFAVRQTAFELTYNEVQVKTTAKLNEEQEARKFLEEETARKEAEAIEEAKKEEAKKEEARKEEEAKREARAREERERRDRYEIPERYPRAIEYRINFYANGGLGYMSSDSFVGEGYYTLPLCSYTAPSGFHFDGWSVNGFKYREGQSIYVDRDIYVTPIWAKNETEPVPPTPTPTPDPTPTPTPEPGKFNVTFDYNGHGKDTTVSVKDGDKVIEPSKPEAEGYEFKGWFTDKACITPYKFDSEVKADLRLYAKWDAIKYTVTVKEASNGSITANPDKDLTIGSEVNLTVKADDGYQLDTITVKIKDGTSVEVKDNKFKMPAANVTVTATFKEKEYEIKVDKLENGKITVKESAKKDEVITVTVEPAKGYELDKITVTAADDTSVAVNGNTFTMPAKNVTIKATFKKIEYEVKTYTPGNGTVEVEPNKATVGDKITITATPNEGYQIDAITVKTADDKEVEVNGDTFTMPAANVTVTATFKEKEFDINVEQAEGGSINVAKSAKTGASVELTVNEKPGYKLETLTYTEDGKEEAVEISNKKFKMPANNVTIKATFNKIEYKITVETPEHGTVKAKKDTATIGDEVILEVNPEKGYKLDKITYTVEGSSDEVAIKDNTFVMPSGNVKIKATFTDKEYQIVISKQGDGTVQAPEKAKKGDIVKLTITAKEGYKLGTVTVTDEKNSSITVSNANTFTMPDSNVKVNVTFVKKTTEDIVVDTMLKSAKEFNSDEITINFNPPITGEEAKVSNNANADFDKIIKGTYLESILTNYGFGVFAIISKAEHSSITTCVSVKVKPILKYHHYLDKERYELEQKQNQTEADKQKILQLEKEDNKKCKEREAEVDAYVERVINENDLRNKTHYEAIKIVHDYIIKNAAYFKLKASTDNKKVDMIAAGCETIYTVNTISVHSAYAIVKEQLGVCQAYAGLFQKFMEKLGIESYYVTGKTTGNHAWNLVKLDGKYYNIDLTFDDPTSRDSQEDSVSGIERYDYFLKGNKSFNTSHTRESLTEINVEDEDYPNAPTGLLNAQSKN